MIGNKRQAIDTILDMPDDVLIEVKEWKPKRSRSQNGYYWILATQIADVMRLSKTVVHNLLLRDYGQPVFIGGEKHYSYIPDTEKAEQEVLRQEEYHLKPTGYISMKNNKRYRAYCSLLGSRFYNTKEMSILLDGCIQEAESVGIKTLSPNEIARMRAEDERYEERRLQKRDSTGV